jgi:hypothetical protein
MVMSTALSNSCKKKIFKFFFFTLFWTHGLAAWRTGWIRGFISPFLGTEHESPNPGVQKPPGLCLQNTTLFFLRTSKTSKNSRARVKN